MAVKTNFNVEEPPLQTPVHADNEKLEKLVCRPKQFPINYSLNIGYLSCCAVVGMKKGQS